MGPAPARLHEQYEEPGNEGGGGDEPSPPPRGSPHLDGQRVHDLFDPNNLARNEVGGACGDASVAWPSQRSARGTPRMTSSTCWPQPAHVVLPHFLQVTALHMVILLIGLRINIPPGV